MRTSTNRNLFWDVCVWDVWEGGAGRCVWDGRLGRVEGDQRADNHATWTHAHACGWFGGGEKLAAAAVKRPSKLTSTL